MHASRSARVQLRACAAVFLACTLLGSSTVHAASSKSKKQSKTIDAKACQEWGFTSEVLCSDCDSLAEFVKDEALVSECRQCCVRDQGAGAARFVSVELQMGTGRINGLPEVKHFVEKMAAKYSSVLSLNLHGNMNVGARFKCKRADGGFEFIRVDNWKRGDFEEFFADRVERA